MIFNFSNQRIICAIVVLLVNVALITCQISNIPGSQTAAGVLASSADGMSRYLAPDGPIQPAITAIGGLPMRGAEMVNGGLDRISSGFNRGAQRLSQAANQNGNIRMPGLDSVRQNMPNSISQFGSMMQDAIRSKNSFIMNQARRGVESSQRLGSKIGA